MSGKLRFFFIIVFLSSLALAQQEAPSLLVSNSAEWQDVYSTMQYAAINGATSNFLVSARHSTLLLNQLSKDSSMLIVSSTTNPYVIGYKSVLESRGFDQVEEVKVAGANLELARRLPATVKDFVILDDSYGYNAISVAPYAAISKSYVLFATKRNINLVYSYLKSRDVRSVILYGQLDPEVKERLSEFSPEKINEGDRFLDNQKIVDKYQAAHRKMYGEPKKQAILTNGEFIEQEIMSGVEPVVFIGRSNVPDQVRNYIKSSDIEIGILIGNELIGSATFIRRELGISVFVKFAQSARQPSSTISPVEDLDRFYLPRYMLELDVFQIRYNRASGNIEVTYQNKVDLATFLKTNSLIMRYQGGSQTLGDETPIFIDKLQYKTLIYETKADGSKLDPMLGNISAELFAIYGESKNSLEYTLRKTVEVETVSVIDNSKIEIVSVLYDKASGRFLVEIKNTGATDAFVNIELLDLLINDELVTRGGDKIVLVKKGESITIEVTSPMTEADLAANPKIRVRAYYGERERNLVNVVEGEFIFGYTGFGYMTGMVLKQVGENAIIWMPAIVILILLILILGMKKKCPHCGEINSLRAKRCSKCHSEI
ncbi:MAG: hypothetical protein HGA85_00940 [Nanoarchaeota archaeon]|nr:hypothetical protein [Nanoarchaeota archaeon]